jgi:hypothetical protein
LLLLLATVVRKAKVSVSNLFQKAVKILTLSGRLQPYKIDIKSVMSAIRFTRCGHVIWPLFQRFE